MWDLEVAAQVKDAMVKLPTRNGRDRARLLRGKDLPRGRHVLEQPEGTVKSRIRSGMRRMRTELAKSGVGLAGEQS